MDKNRLLELDAIRGLAALAVVIYHYFYRYNGIYGHHGITVEWSEMGQYGVQLFFMVSGFVIYWTLNRAKKPMDFLVSRFSRLYPAYWISGILTFSVILIWGLPGRETSIHHAFMNILMFHEYIGISHIDGVYWTLTIELTFYCWIFAFFVTGLLQYAEYLFSPIIILSILQSQGIIELPSLLNKIFIIHYLSYFLAGICFYKLVNGVENRLTSAILILSLISIFFVFSMTVFILSAIFYTFFFFAVTGKLKFLTIKPLLFLGGISYSLYLIHQNIGYVIINQLYNYNINPLISIGVSLFITIVLAYFITHFVEKPSLVAIRKIYRKFT